MGGDTPYSIMFGPDICGHATKRVHVILANKHDRLPANLMIKDDIECKTDTLTHVYTLILYPNNTYVVKIDDEPVSTGSVEEMWDFLPPKDIKDPAATKPEDWDDRPHVPDEDDVKPDGYDDVPGEFIWLFLVIFGYFWLFLVIFIWAIVLTACFSFYRVDRGPRCVEAGGLGRGGGRRVDLADDAKPRLQRPVATKDKAEPRVQRPVGRTHDPQPRLRNGRLAL